MLSPIPFLEDKWLKSFIVHIAARQLQRSFQQKVNTSFINQYLYAGQIQAVAKANQRRENIVFYAAETTGHLYDYIDPKFDAKSATNASSMLYKQAEMAFTTMMNAVIHAHIYNTPLDLSAIPDQLHDIAESYHSALHHAIESELEKVAACFTEETIAENNHEAQQQEQANREKVFTKKSTFVEQHSTYKRVTVADTYVGNVVTARGSRSYMEDRALLEYLEEIKDLPADHIPQLLTLLSLRLSADCLLDTATHTNGSTTASAFVIGDDIYTMNSGDSTVFLTYQDEQGVYHCERLTPEQRPNTSREHTRLRAEGARTACHGSRLADLRGGFIGVSSSYGHYAQYGQWKGLSPYPMLGKRSIKGLTHPRIIICSDGLTDGLNEKIIEDTLNKWGFDKPTGERLRSIAQMYGSSDNIAITIFDAISGMMGTVHDGHGYPGEGHLTSHKLMNLFIVRLRYVIANYPQLASALGDMLAVIPEPTPTLSATLELSPAANEDDLAASPVRKRVKIADTSSSQPLPDMGTERPRLVRAASLPLFFQSCREEEASLLRSSSGVNSSPGTGRVK